MVQSKHNTNDEYVVTQIPILLNAEDNTIDSPHFFMKWYKANKRYRVSISFKYLYKKWGFRVNVIRDTSKIGPDKLKFLYKLLEDDKAIFRKINFRNTDDFLGFRHFIDEQDATEIFIFKRVFDKESNKIIVFLSTEFWNIQDYLETKKIKGDE